MSSYLNFYLRVNDNFIPVGSYSRSNEIYQEFRDIAPFEKIRAITEVDLDTGIFDLTNKINKSKARVESCKEDIENILRANNTMEDKIGFINDTKEMIEEYKEIIAECEHWVAILDHFKDMIDEYRYAIDYPYEDEDNGVNKFTNDYNHYLYMGVEALGCIDSIVGE